LHRWYKEFVHACTSPVHSCSRCLPVFYCSDVGALKEYQGAIVAITHNRAFAESLDAT